MKGRGLSCVAILVLLVVGTAFYRRSEGDEVWANISGSRQKEMGCLAGSIRTAQSLMTSLAIYALASEKIETTTTT